MSATLISVLGAGLIGMLFHYLRDLSTRFSSLELAVKNLGTNVTSELGALDTKFTGAIKDQDTKVTGAIKDLEIRLSHKFTVEIKALDTKFTAQLKDHSERLARIEAKLDIDPPPAEAA